ncbi:MAG: winged helix-turn-helix domain-containing protein [Natronomonas sp.]
MTESSIRKTTETRPGIHFNELLRELDLTPDKLQRLAGELQQEGAITVDEFYGKTHFYPPEYDRPQRRAIALLRRETSREILCHLLERGTANPSSIADDLEIARSTLEWHCDRLIDAELVQKERDGRRVQFVLTRPEEVTTLLREIDPSVGDRVLDRTTRLFDHVLEDNG